LVVLFGAFVFDNLLSSYASLMIVCLRNIWILPSLMQYMDDYTSDAPSDFVLAGSILAYLSALCSILTCIFISGNHHKNSGEPARMNVLQASYVRQ
jgi:hypothetical protein